MRRIKHGFSTRKFQQITSPENQLSDPKCRKRHRFSGEQVGMVQVAIVLLQLQKQFKFTSGSVFFRSERQPEA